jgi:hypothetical protein
MAAGHEMTGGALSITVILNEQLGPAVVVQVTVVVPTLKNDPDGGAQLTVPQSPGVVAEKVTVAPQEVAVGEVNLSKSAGQVIVQVPTVTVKVQLLVFSDASLAVQVTVVTPTGNVEPEGGLQAVVTPEQLSAAVGGG